MKKLYIFTALLLLAILMAPAFGQRHMIHTYWHQLDGPYWIYKPAGISIAQDYIYTFGSNKDGEYRVFKSDDRGATWSKYIRNDWPANSISACQINGQDAYYTSPGIDVFSTFDAGGEWRPSLTIPPGNLNFTVCAANQFEPDKAVTGCIHDGVNSVLWKTEDHGDTWLSVSGLPDFTVNDAKWHPEQGYENDYLVAFDGVEGNCFYQYDSQQSQFENRSPQGLLEPMAEAVCFDIDYTDQTRVIVAGYGSEGWVLAWCSTPSYVWHGGSDQLPLPPGFTSENKIFDISIYGNVSGLPGFYMATDIGVFKNNGEGNWEHVYDNSADNIAVSVGYSRSGQKVFAGTIHRFLTADHGSYAWNPVDDVMFRADLKSVWANSSNSDYCYTLNQKTGAIFGLSLDFNEFTPLNPDPQIQLSEDDIVANISGIDGEFDGIAIAGYNNTVIASSRDDQGEGKLIRRYSNQWEEVSILGNPAFEALAMDNTYSYGAFGGASHNFYRGDGTGDNWEIASDLQTAKVNDLFVFYFAERDYVVLSAKYEFSEDNILALWDNVGQTWISRENGLAGVSEVYRVVRLDEDSPAAYAATNRGIFKTNNLISGDPWVLKDNQLPPGNENFTDILAESGEYELDPPPPPEYRYKPNFVVQAVLDNGATDRFFISADSARSWNEDSSFPLGLDCKVSRLWNYNFGFGNQAQTGIVATTDDGLIYHPHNVINGMYWGDDAVQNRLYYWGPGLILVNGDVIIRPKAIDLPEPIFKYASLNVSPGTSVKIAYKFNSGQEELTGIEVNDWFGATGTDEENLNTFTSSRTTGYSGDWRGIVSKYYTDEIYGITNFPITQLNYCLVECGLNGLSSESSLDFRVEHSIIKKNDANGIYCVNLAQPPGDQLFLIWIRSNLIYDNSNRGIRLVGTAEWIDCSEPWDPKDPPPDPDKILNPEYPPDPKNPPNPQLPCDYLYWTFAFVDSCEIYNCNGGIMANGVMLLYTTFNNLYQVDHYGIQLNNGIASWLWINDIRAGTAEYIKYSGVSLDNPFLALIERNEISNCLKAGLESCGRSFAFILGNYFRDNDFSNIYVMDSYPLIMAWYGAVPEEYPNSLIGAEIGCYILRTDFEMVTQPGILNNRIKGYSKSGIYVVNSATPIFGTEDYWGENSIAEGAPESWNFFWDEYLPPSEPILAIGNWWGSDDPGDFRFVGNLEYEPWLDYDPYPGMQPKAVVNDYNLPKGLLISSAYPNPFNSKVVYEFNMPAAGMAQGIIYDLLGRQVKIVTDQYYGTGKHSVFWDGKSESGRPVSSGIYFFRLESGDRYSVKKATLLK